MRHTHGGIVGTCWLTALTALAAQQQEQQTQTLPPAPVVALGAVANHRVPVVSAEEGVRLDAAVAAASPPPDSALAWTVVMRCRAADWSVLVVDATRPHTNFRLLPGDAFWIAAAPGKSEPPLSMAGAIVAAVRSLLAVPPPEDRRALLFVWLLTHSGDRIDRHDAAQALAQLADRGLAMRHLVGVLDLDPSVAQEAVVALGTMGADAASALPELRRLADHRDLALRAAVATAIRQIEPAK